jgi:hypothetical protein
MNEIKTTEMDTTTESTENSGNVVETSFDDIRNSIGGQDPTFINSEDEDEEEVEETEEGASEEEVVEDNVEPIVKKSANYIPFSKGEEVLKVNGQEFRVKDWEEAKSLIQKGQGAYERFQEASQLNKEAREVETQAHQRVQESEEKLRTVVTHLKELAVSDPQALLETLGVSGGATENRVMSKANEEDAGSIDPRDAQILKMAREMDYIRQEQNAFKETYERQLREVSEKARQAEVASYQTQIEEEMAEIEGEMPVFQDRFVKNALVREYSHAYKEELDYLTGVKGLDPATAMGKIQSMKEFAYIMNGQIMAERKEKETKQLQSRKIVKPASFRSAPVDKGGSRATTFESLREQYGL